MSAPTIVSPANVEEFFGSKDRHEAWIAEAIWGHRLEFLGMAEGMFRQGKLLEETRPGENPEYVANRCLQLRNLLFNNPRMEEILRDAQGDDAAGWDKWLQVMQERASLGDRLRADFSYLRKRFATFAELVSVVRLLRRITVDSGSERSWTVQFIFPIGPAALYEAILEKGEGFERTRRVFTRTGELAYLMLTRASKHLRDQICERLELAFAPATPRNKLVMRLIESPEPDLGDKKGGTYLPYKWHPAFDRMAEDVLAILKLDLPDQDAFQYLQPLLGLHVYLYGIETANYWLGASELPPIVCEILAPKNDLVRKAAVGSYLCNDGLGLRAVRRFLDHNIFSDADLAETLADPTLDEVAKKSYLAEYLGRTCAFKHEKEQFEADTAEVYKRKFYGFAERLYHNGAADGLTALATGCGLVSKRGTNRYRYAPTDDLLRALVLANVASPLEESVFLQHIWSRYRMIIGPIEAKVALTDYEYDEPDFKNNRSRLTQRLIGMGLAQRMSDACTYVSNPMDSRQ